MNPSDLPAWFAQARQFLESAYLAAPGDQPWAQSGTSGPAATLFARLTNPSQV